MAIVNKSKLTLNKAQLDHDVISERRKPLLEAWDIMVANAAFGTVKISYIRKEELIEWHQAILDRDEEAINNVPDEVKYYLGIGDASSLEKPVPLFSK